jgi:N-acetylneuraminate synthase
MFIAEIGINHNGDIDKAEELIVMAKKARADVVKFQKRNPDKCVPELQKEEVKKTPWGDMTYLEYKKRLEFGKEEYDRIDRVCKLLGIKWTASVWDEDSYDFIRGYNPEFIKIPSAMITNRKLWDKSKADDTPIIMSIGMSTRLEVDRAVEEFEKNLDGIMQCNSSYPAKDNELNLGVIQSLKRMYPHYKIGYSGHEIGIGASLMAKVLGADIIERHVTLNRNDWGSDQKCSLEYKELKQLISDIKMVNTWKGKSKIVCYPDEVKIKNKLRI